MNANTLSQVIEPRSVVSVPRSSVADLVIQDLAAENAMLSERVASLEADTRTYHELNAALVDVIADLAYRNYLLCAVAEYRCQHNPDLLDLVMDAAKAGHRQRTRKVRTTSDLPASMPSNNRRQDEGATCH